MISARKQDAPAWRTSSVSPEGNMIFGMGREAGRSANLGNSGVWFVAPARGSSWGKDETKLAKSKHAQCLGTALMIDMRSLTSVMSTDF